MDIERFRASLNRDAPPEDVSSCTAAMWHAANGAWDAAHDLVQSDPSADASWVHAYLHRVEGDLPNAGYWYRRAGRPVATGSLDVEWGEIVSEFLARDR